MSFILVKNSAKTITTLTNVFFGSVPRPQKLKSRRIKNAKKITYSQWKSFAFQTVAFFSDIACLFLVIIYNQLQQLINGQQQKQHMADTMLVTAVCSAIFHTMSYTCDLKVQVLTDQQRQIKLSEIFKGIFKFIFLLIHPSELFTLYQFENQPLLFHNINTIFTIICYFRIIFIYSYFAKNSKYYGTRISRLLSVYGHRNKATNIIYAIKCLFKQQGIFANLFLFLFATVFLALVVILVSNQQSLLTQIYLCLETMATIGYGQYPIQGSLERFIMILVIISGSFAGSAFTIYFLEFLQLEDKQSKAYRLIKRLTIQDQISQQKVKVIQKFLKRKISPSVSRNIWKTYQKQLSHDKSPIIEFLTMKYTYFCNSLKTLLQSQLLSNNLMTFYFNRMEKHDIDKQLQATRVKLRPISKKRAEDTKRLYNMKRKILGYKSLDFYQI